MPARTFQRDSGGVPRLWKRIFLRDAGGVTRTIKRLFLRDSSGIARLIFSGADFFTIVCGTANNSNGYVNGGIGSISPNNQLGDGSTLQQLSVSNIHAPVPGTQILSINAGPGVNITANYISTLTIGVNVFTPAGATFAGGGVSGQWTWTGAGIFSGTISVVIQRT